MEKCLPFPARTHRGIALSISEILLLVEVLFSDDAFQLFPLLLFHERLPKNVLSDACIELTGYYPKMYFPQEMRMERYWEEQKRAFMFLTDAVQVNQIYIICNSSNFFSGH